MDGCQWLLGFLDSLCDVCNLSVSSLPFSAAGDLSFQYTFFFILIYMAEVQSRLQRYFPESIEDSPS